MKLVDSILLSLGAGFIIIGIHQNMTAGFGSAYGVIMLAFLMFFIYVYRKKR